jgi:hypothetical protein
MRPKEWSCEMFESYIIIEIVVNLRFVSSEGVYNPTSSLPNNTSRVIYRNSSPQSSHSDLGKAGSINLPISKLQASNTSQA